MLLPAMVLAVLVAGTMIFVAFDTNWAISDRSAFEDTTTAIGDLLLDRYALPFEIASVLLLSAILGAILLVRPEGAEEEME